MSAPTETTISAWVVLLEAADTRDTERVSYESVQRLLGQLWQHQATGLYSPDRYAIQLVLRTARPATAVDTAQQLWEDAVLTCGLPQWELVRAEVKTVAELQAELAAQASITRPAWPSAVPDGPSALDRSAPLESAAE